ncbi:MAG TPA: hypothetical protein VJP89_23655 [Pyrinomonadaceae bacterium]|nr:hypothetical protein [Pyrinomonadaceae bacterium]
MTTGLQFTGSLAANQTQRWSTTGWNPTLHVVWYVMPVTPRPGAAELQWSVGVERASATQCTYWITVTNLTATAITFEGRYAILS